MDAVKNDPEKFQDAISFQSLRVKDVIVHQVKIIYENRPSLFILALQRKQQRSRSNPAFSFTAGRTMHHFQPADSTSLY